jgi:O-antigen ligase
MKLQKLIDRLLFAGVVAAVVFTALAFGTVDPWSVAIFQLLVVILAALWSVRFIITRELAIDVPAVGFPIAALLGIGLVQGVAFGQNDGHIASLSRDPEATRAAVLNLACLGICFLIGVNTLNNRARVRVFIDCVIAFGMVLSVFALVQHFGGNGKIYWFRYNRQGASAFGPFINHNHFAGYMEMLIPLPIGLMLHASSLRLGLARLLFYGFSAGMMSVALLASLSRGGLIGIVAGLGMIGLWDWRRRAARESLPGRRSMGVAVLAGLVAIVAAGLLWLGPGRVIDRIAGSLSSDADGSGETFLASRGQIWKDTLAMIAANPVIGVGLGAYETAYPTYSESDGTMFVRYAHNDYLQVLADEGLVGGAILIWFLVLSARLIARGLRYDDAYRSALGMGIGAGIVGILVHSLLDFNLQLPSNALLFLMLIGVATSLNAIPAVRRSASHLTRSNPAVATAAG